MSYGIRIWSSKQINENSPLLVDAGFKSNGDFFVRDGKNLKNWQVVISHSLSVEPEDIPDNIMQLLPGISYLTEVNIEPISAPDKIRRETIRLCNTIAKEIKGVVEDPQTGIVKTPSGVKKILCDSSDNRDKSTISISWYFDDADFYKSDKIDRFIDLLQKYMPDALPRRYGRFEPPQHKFTETGKAYLIEFWKQESGIVWYAAKPFTYLLPSVPNFHEELKSGLGMWKKYRCGKIELQMLRDVFFQGDWNLAVKRLFIEVARILNVFYAEIIDERLRDNRFAWWWRGIPKDLGYAAILNQDYTNQFRDFEKIADKISNNLYMVDFFGESNFKSVIEKVGKVPLNIAAPDNDNKTAKHFPFKIFTP
jgi:hypothetical protein